MIFLIFKEKPVDESKDGEIGAVILDAGIRTIILPNAPLKPAVDAHIINTRTLSEGGVAA